MRRRGEDFDAINSWGVVDVAGMPFRVYSASTSMNQGELTLVNDASQCCQSMMTCFNARESAVLNIPKPLKLWTRAASSGREVVVVAL